MDDFASQWRFEEAQIAKIRYDLVEKYNAKSVIASAAKGEADMFAYDENGDSAYVNFMHLHNGAVVQSLTLEYRRRLAETREEILSMAVGEISRRFERSFAQVIVPFLPDVEFDGISFIIPKRGDKKKILEVGMKTVRQYMQDKEE